jgi:catechol 2,3-dioxygenase-like lactoylglutathione lyase family enzyme
MSGTVDVRGVEHVGMVVGDSESLARWYADVFGARELSRSNDAPPIVFLGFGGGSLLELVPGKAPATQATDHVHMSFSVNAIPEAVKGLKGAGIALERPVFKAYEGSPVAFLRDPEGNLLQLVERVSDLPQPK